MPHAAFSDRLRHVQDVIAERQSQRGWTHPVTVIAVTKTHPAAAVRAALNAGVRDVGENRVQEALAKQDEVGGAEAVRWHLIGSLQRNKARHAVGRFALIHSVDSVELAVALDSRVAGPAKQPVLLQVNCSNEPQKGGVAPIDAAATLSALRKLGGLSVQGLMTMSAFDANETAQHRTFAALRELRDTLREHDGDLPELSMGMSDDYAAAVDEGATMVRLGTALFGSRC